MVSNKKSQVTAFIIIAIILVFSSALVFYIRGQFVAGQINAEPILEKIPEDIVPVRTYIEECIEQTAIEGLILAGSKGGYISFDEDIVGQDVSFRIEHSPTRSELVEVYPQSGAYVPYWYYLKGEPDCTTCRFGTKQPKISKSDQVDDPYDSSVERQLDRYIKRELTNCIDSFKPFVEQGYEINIKDDMVVDTTIANSDVRVTVNYPIEVIKSGSTTNVKTYYKKIPLNFRRIYALANDITNAEINYSFSERSTLNLLAGLGGLGRALPPMREVEIDSSPKYWVKTQVKQEVQNMLAMYTPMIQVENAGNFFQPQYADQLSTALYRQFVIPVIDNENLTILSSDFTAVDSEFDFFSWWPIYFDIVGQDELIGPTDDITLNLLLFRFQSLDYQITYDLSYPVMVTLIDPTVPERLKTDERGYVFSFALEANIRNNQPLRLNQTIFSANNPGRTLFSDEQNRNSGNLSLRIVDAETGENLSGVNAFFVCGPEGAHIGYSDSEGSINDRFPQCLGGLLKLTLEDYHPSAVLVDAIRGEDQDLGVVFMEPYHYLNVSVIERAIKKVETTEMMRVGPTAIPRTICRWKSSLESPDALDEDEYAAISVRRLRFGTETELSEYVLLDDEDSGEQQIRLIPGTYEVTVTQYIKDSYLRIPPETRSTGGLFGVTYTIPEIVLDGSILSGGAILKNTTQYWVVSRNDLAYAKMVIFQTISPDLLYACKKTINDLEYLENTELYSKTYPDYVRPILQ